MTPNDPPSEGGQSLVLGQRWLLRLSALLLIGFAAMTAIASYNHSHRAGIETVEPVPGAAWKWQRKSEPY